jgi:hypothetical protein
MWLLGYDVLLAMALCAVVVVAPSLDLAANWVDAVVVLRLHMFSVLSGICAWVLRFYCISFVWL